MLIFFLSKELLDHRFKSNKFVDGVIRLHYERSNEQVSNFFSQSSPLLSIGVSKRLARTHERDKRLNGRVFRLVDYWIEVVVYTGRHLRECRVALGHPAGSGFIEKSRTAGYLYLYGQLFNRTLKSADFNVAQAAGKFSEPPCFPYKAFVDVRAFCHNFARQSTAPTIFFFPFRARTATADFPPLTQPFKNEIKKNQVSCFEIEGKKERRANRAWKKWGIL